MIIVLGCWRRRGGGFNEAAAPMLRKPRQTQIITFPRERERFNEAAAPMLRKSQRPAAAAWRGWRLQ